MFKDEVEEEIFHQLSRELSNAFEMYNIERAVLLIAKKLDNKVKLSECEIILMQTYSNFIDGIKNSEVTNHLYN